MVKLRATIVIAQAVDPAFPSTYTRSGLNVTFRPKWPTSEKSRSFFTSSDQFCSELELRQGAKKWEPVLHSEERMRGSSLDSPVFDIHHVARSGGDNTTGRPIPYAMVISLVANRMPNIYDQVRQRYNQLQAIQPIPVHVPVRVG